MSWLLDAWQVHPWIVFSIALSWVVQKKIRLSEEQRTELLRRRRLFFTQIGSLVDERRRIHAHIKVSWVPARQIRGRSSLKRPAPKELSRSLIKCLIHVSERQGADRGILGCVTGD